MTKNGDFTGATWYWTGFMGSVVQTGPILKGSSSCGRDKKIIHVKLYYKHFLHINNIKIKTNGGHANTDHDPHLVPSCWWW